MILHENVVVGLSHIVQRSCSFSPSEIHGVAVQERTVLSSNVLSGVEGVLAGVGHVNVLDYGFGRHVFIAVLMCEILSSGLIGQLVDVFILKILHV